MEKRRFLRVGAWFDCARGVQETLAIALGCSCVLFMSERFIQQVYAMKKMPCNVEGFHSLEKLVPLLSIAIRLLLTLVIDQSIL